MTLSEDRQSMGKQIYRGGGRDSVGRQEINGEKNLPGGDVTLSEDRKSM